MSYLGRRFTNFKRGLFQKIFGFHPYYPNHRVKMESEYPEIFNKEGRTLKVFFISDLEFAHAPYQGVGKYILWDRYNYALKTHFYSHDEAFRPVGKPDRRFAFLCESRSIKPETYVRFLKAKKYLESEYDLVFSYDSEVLDTLNNARFVPFCAGFWYGKYKKDVNLSEQNYKNKSRSISILSSSKTKSWANVLRKSLAQKCKRSGLADTFGTFDGGTWVAPEVTLEHYRYSIIIENDITPFFFTEKLTNCFAAQVIPIYLGATQIHRFFNPDGLITLTLEDVDRIEDVLKQCTPQEYERRLPAIIDNFHRVQRFKNPMDYMFEEYLLPYYSSL